MPRKGKAICEGGLRTRSVNKKPKFTLITVVLNNILEKTIKGIFDQNFKILNILSLMVVPMMEPEIIKNIMIN